MRHSLEDSSNTSLAKYQNKRILRSFRYCSSEEFLARHFQKKYPLALGNSIFCYPTFIYFHLDNFL